MGKKEANIKRGRAAKRKGNSFENRVATMIQEYFNVDRQIVHRTPMSGGHVERGDIIVKLPLLPHFPYFFECRDRSGWSWENIFKSPENSIIMKWFIEDAMGKNHPSNDISRTPLLVFHKPYDDVYVMYSESYFLADGFERFRSSYLMHTSDSPFIICVEGGFVIMPFMSFIHLHGSKFEV